MNTTTAAPAVPTPLRILCVDDEPSILSALKRLFRSQGFAILTANSGKEALEMLAAEPVDLVISDMRMPEMDGAQFLGEVFARWPETTRILLTGYADATTTIAAINRGHIWRYVSKPWNDDELLQAVHQALAHQKLARENTQLTQLTQRQNEQLKQLNAGLEAKVAARTAELQQAHDELKRGFLTMVRVLTGLFELRSRRLAGHSRRVAETARQIARDLKLDDNATQEILLAALLHDIGKFGLPDHLLEKPFHNMTPAERSEIMHHPTRGEAVLIGIEQLKGAARLVRCHHENFDGSGFPDNLVGLAIPQGARILAVANDFDALQMGTLVPRQLKPAEARAFILENRGKRYDPSVVDVFLTQIADSIPEEIAELPMRPGTLCPGMVLTRDLLHPDGYLLLARGQVVDASVIEQLVRIELTAGTHLTLHIQPEKK